MTKDEIKQNAARVIEKAEVIEAGVKSEFWKVLTEVLETLIANEMKTLRGQKPDEVYYRKIGFTQMAMFIKAIPTFVKDEKTRKYLLSQGRMSALETFLNLPNLFKNQKALTLQQLQQMFVSGEETKREFIQNSFNQM